MTLESGLVVVLDACQACDKAQEVLEEAKTLPAPRKKGYVKSADSRIYDENGVLVSKVCSRCQERKDAAEFSRRERSPDGLQTTCKQCHKRLTLMRGYS